MMSDDIIRVARSALGVPFRHQGRSLLGLDCVGLILYVADCLGITCTDVEGYSRRPSGGLLETAFDQHVSLGILMRVDPDAMQPGDFLMMRFEREPQHIAILTGENIIHSHLAVGKVCEHRLDDKWRSRIVRVYRLIGVTE